MGIKISNKVKVKRPDIFTPIPDGQYSKPIQLNPDLVFHNMPLYASDSLGNKLTAANLCDISTINNVNGVPLGTPANAGVALNAYNGIKSDWYNIKYYKIQFDLDGIYDLDYAYVWIEGGNKGPIILYGSEDGTTLKTLYGPDDGLNISGWLKLDFNTEAKSGNRYFVIGMYWADMAIKGLILYGRPAGSKINHGVKFNRKVPVRKADQTIGTNGFYFEHPDMMSEVSAIQRFYVEPDWFFGDAFRSTGDAIGKTPDDLLFKFGNSHMGSIDQLLQGFKNTGSKVMFTQVTQPVCYRPIGTAKAGQSKPVDPGFSSTNLIHTTNPMNYKFIARVGYNIAARYGNNKNVDQQYIQLQTGQDLKVGLNLIYCMEIGNEMDKWWLGEQAYTNPEEMAAYMSALYDGHKGALGPGYGIKAADPSMKISMISLAAGDNTAYIRQMLWWFDKYRGKGDYAFDVINYHWYNSSEGSQDIGDTSYGLQPERAFLMDVNQKWSNIRDTYCQSAELWLTETGYDEHLGGVYSPRFNTQALRSKFKAYWLSRMFLVNMVTGVDVTNQYWYATTGGQKLEDLNPNEPDPSKFISSALAEGIQSTDDWNRKPLTSFWYLANLKNALNGYTYSHPIIIKGVRKTSENLIISTDINIWAVAFKNVVDGTGLIAVWLDSAEQRQLTTTLQVLEPTVGIVNINDAEIRKSLTGTVSTVVSNQGLIPITLTECPIFISTTNIGTPLIIQPSNIETQVLSDNSTLVTWVDKNIDIVDAKVSRSLILNGVYTLIYQGITQNAQYIDTTTSVGTSYFYKIELIQHGNLPPQITPTPPILTSDDVQDTLIASHANYPNDIVVSIADNPYEDYTGLLSIGNVSRPIGYFKFKIKAGFNRTESSIVLSPAFTISDTPPPELWKTTLDNAYLATGTVNNNNVVTTSGDEVLSFTDQIGSLLMTYTGATDPVLSHAKPRYYDNLGGYVFFPNETNVKYATNFIDNNHYPCERWLIGIISNYQVYEAFVNNFYSPYIGDLGQQGMRTKSAADFAGDTTWKTDIPISLNRPFIIRQKFTDDSTIQDRVTTEMWINGVYVGHTMTTYKNAQMQLVVGADTNNSHWGLMFYGFKNSLINDTIATNMTNQLMAKYNIGLPINVPYADSLSINKVGTQYAATFTFKSVDGVLEDITRRKVRWVYLESGPTVSYYMHELDGKLSFNSNDYPQYNFANKTIRIEVTCYDIQGRFLGVPQTVLVNT